MSSRSFLLHVLLQAGVKETTSALIIQSELMHVYRRSVTLN